MNKYISNQTDDGPAPSPYDRAPMSERVSRPTREQVAIWKEILNLYDEKPDSTQLNDVFDAYLELEEENARQVNEIERLSHNVTVWHDAFIEAEQRKIGLEDTLATLQAKYYTKCGREG